MSVLTIVESHADLRGLYGSQIFHSHLQNLRLLQFTRSLKKTNIRIEKNEYLFCLFLIMSTPMMMMR